jgi:hypothetical protein
VQLRGCGCRSVMWVLVWMLVWHLYVVVGGLYGLYVGGQALSNERAGGWHIAWV